LEHKPADVQLEIIESTNTKEGLSGSTLKEYPTAQAAMIDLMSKELNVLAIYYKEEVISTGYLRVLADNEKGVRE